ncbi:MAG: DUF432 domain-containing protein [Verrucomicrobiae bacterium]|nr:DUF432 domain-containing protein [Verrucomicrobiae bacterium]
MDLNLAKDWWGKHPLEQERLDLEVGDLHATCRYQRDEFWIQYHYQSAIAASTQGIQTGKEEWSRHIARKLPQSIEITPCLPDRGVVVRPEQDFFLDVRAKAKVYVRVPIWLRFSYAASDPQSKVELPSVVLSLTWFGEFDHGELCYWISSSAKREYQRDEDRLFLAVCPIHITNEADEKLLISKLRLRVETLALFVDNFQLWGNETRVTYRGKDSVSKVEIVGGPPKEAKQATKISTPRRSITRAMNLRTFGRAWNWSGSYDI